MRQSIRNPYCDASIIGKEIDAGQAGGNQNAAKAAHTFALFAAANAGAPAYDPMRAVHESAHAVIIDDLGYRVTLVNIKAGEPQMTQADWGAFCEAMSTINWNSAAMRDAIRPQVLGYVTMLVAGHLAESLVDGAIERISTRIQNNLWLHPT